MRSFFNASRYPALFIILCYFLISALLTWPLVFHLNSSLFGDFGDTRGTAWGIWTRIYGLLDGSINHWIAAPFGVIAGNGFSQPVSEWLYVVFAQISNEIVAYNLFVLLAFPLTGIATYFLLNRLLHNRAAAFAGGLIFGFCPAAIMQAAGGHASYAFNAFIPIFIWALFYNRTQRTRLSEFYVAANFALITLTALYFGYFAIFIAIYFFVFDLMSCNSKDRLAIVRGYIYAVMFAVILILPFEYKEIYHQLISSADVLKSAGHSRDFNELNVYSSRYWEFLIPSIDHPVLGNVIYDFAKSHLHGSNIFEQTLYLGVIPISLFLTGLILVSFGKFNAALKANYLFFAFGALWMYFLSLPPQISFGGIQVPTLSFFAYKIAPMFRVYARFGILVNFFVACSAAVVLAHLYQHMKRARYYAMLAVLMPVLAFEYRSISPGYALPVDQPPNVYSWLAQQPGDIIVAEYPMMKSDEASFYTYLFWQRIHKKKLVNGAARDNEKAWDFFEKVKNLDDSNTPLRLKSAGVKYVIVHSDTYQEGPIPRSIKRCYSDDYAKVTYNGGRVPVIPFPLKLVKAFGSDFVFAWDEGKK